MEKTALGKTGMELSRARIVLATKVGARLKEPRGIRNTRGEVEWARVPGEYELLAPGTIRRSVEDSLRRLRTDYIDLYYAHIDDRITPLEDTLEAFHSLVQAGKVRYIGCSNYRTWRLERARRISAAMGWASYIAVQQQYSYLRPKPGADCGVSVHADAELFDYLAANEDVTLLAYSPLLRGIYDDAAKRMAYYNWGLFDCDDARTRLERLSVKAKELGVSNNQLVLAWLAHHQPKVVPVIGASDPAQLEQCLEALMLRLTAEDMGFLNG